MLLRGCGALSGGWGRYLRCGHACVVVCRERREGEERKGVNGRGDGELVEVSLLVVFVCLWERGDVECGTKLKKRSRAGEWSVASGAGYK